MKNGKIINNFECYLVAVLDSEEAKKAEIGQKVLITIFNTKEMNAEIAYSAKQENDKYLIIFKVDTLTQELINYRKISFNITWWSYAGLKTPNTSILEDEQGNKYVVRRKSGQDKKILVKLLKRNEKYSIISNFKPEELENVNIDINNYTKIYEHDTILLYPDSVKN